MISAKNLQIGLVAGVVVLGGTLLVSGAGISLGTLLFVGLLLLCPLMMLGMHGGGGHQHGEDTRELHQPTDQNGDTATRPHVH